MHNAMTADRACRQGMLQRPFGGSHWSAAGGLLASCLVVVESSVCSVVCLLNNIINQLLYYNINFTQLIYDGSLVTCNIYIQF